MVGFPPPAAGGWGQPGCRALSRPLPGGGRLSLRALAGDSVDQPGKKERLTLKNFPLKAAITAGGLALTGDTIAQTVAKLKQRKEIEDGSTGLSPCCRKKELNKYPLWKLDYMRSVRMLSYGFLLYGPFSHFWYRFLDTKLPAKNFKNFLTKVAANQVVLGPLVITAVFSWNFAWMGQLDRLGSKFKKDFAPSMIDGWKFWIPVALLNFSVVPLPARVAFMSSASVFWNFYLSTSVGKQSPKPAVLEQTANNDTRAPALEVPATS